MYLNVVFRYREYVRGVVLAVCHVDGTARPQTVTKEQNRTWYELIRAFRDETGEDIILNTSFNLAGEPLMETSTDAVRSFAFGGFKVLYLQGWLITKP